VQYLRSESPVTPGLRPSRFLPAGWGHLGPTKQRVLFYGSIVAFLVAGAIYSTAMPGASYRGALPPASDAASALAPELEAHVRALAEGIGERRIGEGDSLEQAQQYITAELRRGSGAPLELAFEDLGADGSEAKNISLALPGHSPEVVLVGAHYDSATGTPGANDNASGTAVALALAKRLSTRSFRHTIRIVFFANEEPPYFQNPGMGSLAHAQGCSERGEHIVAMLALESLGFYSEAPGSQRYPWPMGLFYPDRGDFVAFVGNLSSRSLVRRAIGTFRARAHFPSEGAALPSWVPGVDWSDHSSFWRFDFPALMITDTALFRGSHYHQQSDVADTLDYERLARVTLGIEEVIAELAEPL
jgi:hypothetical protein